MDWHARLTSGQALERAAARADLSLSERRRTADSSDINRHTRNTLIQNPK